MTKISSRIKRYAATAVIAVIIVAAVTAVALFYYHHDPSHAESPRCLFRMLTGYDCPGCGAQRAAHALLHGRVAEAWSCNPFLFFAVPAALFFIVVELWRHRFPALYRAVFRPSVMIICLLAILAWWVARNMVIL